MISFDIEKHIKTYKGKQVLMVQGQYPAGSIVKIHGQSGAGKSTFLKIIAGFIRPEKGKIEADGMVWLDTSAKVSLSPQKRMAGFVFQDYALFPNMSVQQHLEFAADDKTWIQQLLEVGKLETLMDHTPLYLSGGQQQRLAILRALANKPKLLLMDEPFSALDPETKQDLIQELKSIFKALGTTVFVVSHNPQELEELAANADDIFDLVIKN